MPSGEMRRTTRVFGMVKGADGARVLRSGRRLSTESDGAKVRRPNDGDECYQMANNSNRNDGIGAAARNCKANGAVDEDLIVGSLKMEAELREDGGRVDRMYGLVYTRKRKRTGVGNFLSISQDKKYGLQFSRRQRGKTNEYGSRKLLGSGGAAVPDAVHFEVSPVFCFLVSNGSTFGWSWWFSCLLSLVLGYMKRAKVRLHELAAFLMSQPLSGVYCSNGVKIVLGPSNGTGVCKIFGAGRFSPLFSLDFYAAPHCFMHIHYSMLLTLNCLRYDPLDDLIDEDSDDEIMTFIETQQNMPSLGKIKVVALDIDSPGNKAVLPFSVRASKLVSRSNQYKTGLSSRGIQKRRSSQRRRRDRNPSLGSVQKTGGAPLSDLTSSRRKGVPFSSVVSKNKLRSSVRNTSGANLRELNSTVADLAKDVDLSCCSASILVIETDRCYREDGAVIKLELTASKEWLLVVQKDSMVKYTHKAQDVLRPCASNRFTHAIIWTGDDNWKLEFPNRLDWLVFKELYKECSDRNVPTSLVKVIPVPGVREVAGIEDIDGLSFRRPYSYISVKADEVSRAMAKRTANYDLDSEDEKWLKTFNNEFLTGSGQLERLSEDSFELMIDAFEKADYCCPDDYSNEKAAANLCLDLGRREVVEAVYGYWLKKRKQRRSALLRVFQVHQVKKAPVVLKPVLRKRRSLKRQASHGRGKQPNLLQAMAVDQGAAAERNVLRRFEATRVSAHRFGESALEKRQRAQLLMENADVATYKAMVAFRIAEAARVAEPLESFVDAFLSLIDE